LASGHAIYLKNIRAEWVKAGLDSERLIIAPRVSVEQYLAQYQLVDLFLDVFPYTSGTTASDALWAGCPLLPLVGQTMVSRMSGSLVRAAGLPELLTYTVDEYVEKAIELAENPMILNDMKVKLLTNRFAAPLFDTKNFVKYLEAAYEQMAKQAFSGEAFKAITIDA